MCFWDESEQAGTQQRWCWRWADRAGDKVAIRPREPYFRARAAGSGQLPSPLPDLQLHRCQGSREVILGTTALGKSAMSTERELKHLRVVFSKRPFSVPKCLGFAPGPGRERGWGIAPASVLAPWPGRGPWPSGMSRGSRAPHAI